MISRNPASALIASVGARLLSEGYGPGAWHGPDLRAAIGDVQSDAAFSPPAQGRHNIAEIALHHAWSVRAVSAKLSGSEAEAFPLQGEDWFDLPDAGTLSWNDIVRTVEAQQGALAHVVAGIAEGRVASPLTESEQFDLVLGVTCHAVYHAGQIQLIKALANSRDDAPVRA